MTMCKTSSLSTGCAFFLFASVALADEGASEKSPAYEAGYAAGQKLMQDLADSITERKDNCMLIQGRADRTRCITEIQRSLGIEPKVTVHGLWEVGVFDDPMTDQKKGSATVQARPDPGSATLSVRCLRGKLDVFSQWSSSVRMPPAGEPVMVRTRIDNDSPVVEEWRMANVSPNVAFYKGDATALANRLVHADRFVIELASSNGTGSNVYDIRMAAEAFARLRRPCAW